MYITRCFSGRSEEIIELRLFSPSFMECTFSTDVGRLTILKISFGVGSLYFVIASLAFSLVL